MTTTEVQHKLLNAREQPRVKVLVTAQLVAPYGYLTNGQGEIGEPITAETGDDGIVKLFLVPQSQIEYVGSAYRVTWSGAAARHISVPNTGPVWLKAILTSPPPIGVPAGRGISSGAVVGGNLILTYTDGTTQNAGALNPGPAGAPGAPGAPGANGTGNTTVVGVTSRISPVLSRLDGASTVFKRGRTRYDLVDDYGADPTGVAAADTAFNAWITDLNALPNSYGELGEMSGGIFKLDAATRYVVTGEGLLLRGNAQNGTILSFTHATGGLTRGVDTELRQGGGLRDFTITGNNTCKNPLLIQWVGGNIFENIRVESGGFLAADTQAVRDRSAAVIVEHAQNCYFQNFQVKNCLGHGIIWDKGTGGHLINVLQINDIGQVSPNRADTRHWWVRNSTPGVAPDLYNGTPQNIRLMQGFMEGLNQTQERVMQFDSGDSMRLSFQTSASSRFPTPLTQAYMGQAALNVTFDACLFRGNNAASGASKVVTGIYAADGATKIRAVNPEFANTLTGFYSESLTGGHSIEGTPIWPSASADVAAGLKLLDGPGARGVAKNFQHAPVASAAGLPAPGVDYFGVIAPIRAPGTGTFDDAYQCLRRGGVYQWVRLTSGGSAPTTVTHVLATDLILDSSVDTQFAATLVGNLTLGQTTNNADGRLTLLTLTADATARTVSFDTTGTGAFVFTTAVPGPTVTVPANKRGYLGWRYSGVSARNVLLAFTVEA